MVDKIALLFSATFFQEDFYIISLIYYTVTIIFDIFIHFPERKTFKSHLKN